MSSVTERTQLIKKYNETDYNWCQQENKSCCPRNGVGMIIPIFGIVPSIVSVPMAIMQIALPAFCNIGKTYTNIFSSLGIISNAILLGSACYWINKYQCCQIDPPTEIEEIKHDKFINQTVFVVSLVCLGLNIASVIVANTACPTSS